MSRTSSQMRQQLSQQQQDIPVNRIVKAYYAYNLVFASIASAASASANVQIQSDSNFMVQALSFSCFDLVTNSQITAPYSTVQITVTSSGTTFFDQAIPILNAFGTAQLPFILPEARILTANSNVSGLINNVSSTNAQYYVLTLHGKKLFDVGA